MMATLTIQLSPETTARLEREARRLGLDAPTYVRLLLGDEDPAGASLADSVPDRAQLRRRSAFDDDLSWRDTPEAVVAAIRARGSGQIPVQEATADLAELLRIGGSDPGIAPAEWDRRWAEYEARQKVLDLAETEKTLREVQGFLTDDTDDR